jgi:hypothetical protein
MDGGSGEIVLTAAQRRFAVVNRAQARLVSRLGGVFMYRDEWWGTMRWLVEPDGAASERTAMHYGSGRDPRRIAARAHAEPREVTVSRSEEQARTAAHRVGAP